LFAAGRRFAVREDKKRFETVYTHGANEADVCSREVLGAWNYLKVLRWCGLNQVIQPRFINKRVIIRMLFDWLVLGQIIPANPASVVRGPKHVIKRGKTPVLSAEDARALLDSIDTSTVVGLRDRALIGVMVYSFARVSATVGMRIEDYYQNGKRSWLRLHEKGGKFHEVPAHHNAEAWLQRVMHHSYFAVGRETLKQVEQPILSGLPA
jgi:site-specific recombinase XerC